MSEASESSTGSPELELSSQELKRIKQIDKDMRASLILARSVLGPKKAIQSIGIIAPFMCALITVASVIGGASETNDLSYTFAGKKEPGAVIVDTSLLTKARESYVFKFSSKDESPDDINTIYVGYVDETPAFGYRDKRNLNFNEWTPIFSMGDDGFGAVDSWRWSKNGDKLVFSVRVADQTKSGIYISDLKPNQKTLVLTEEFPISSVDLSSDGKKIVYAMSDPSDYFSTKIMTFDLESKEKKFLANGEEPIWSPDGREVAFNRRSGGIKPNLWIMNADGSGAKEIEKYINTYEWIKNS